jgi:cation diffusion facilitator family transporter
MQNLNKKALVLSYFTVGYNIIEGIFALFFGTLAGSIALIGFGIDSFVESLSGSIMIWRFRKHENLSEKEEERIEKKATKLVGYSFFVLGVYVLFESVKKLYLQEHPDQSIAGIIIAILSLVIMPTLFYLKYKTGKSLKSKSLVADSKQTLACVIMSVALLIGLGLNYLYGIWWLDPIVGILIALLLFKEGKEALEEEKLGCC